MIEMITKRLLLFAVFIAATIILIVPIANAENVNVTPVTTPFITIDPIGKHTIGDVFFINGTTNLPLSENLTIDIISYKYVTSTHSKFNLGPAPSESAYLPGSSRVPDTASRLYRIRHLR